MSFFDETLNNLNIKNKLNNVFCSFSPDYGIVIEGHKKIIELTPTKIILLCSNNKKMEVLGNNLRIQNIATEEISISGTITAINII